MKLNKNEAQPRSLNEELWPEYQRCFACGAENEIGLQLTLYERNGAVVSRWKPRPEYENFYGIVHGGVVAVALDELGGTAAWLAFRRLYGDEWPLVVTAECTLRFHSPSKMGQTFDVSARVVELHKRHALVEASLGAESSELVSMVARYVKIGTPPGGTLLSPLRPDESPAPA